MCYTAIDSILGYILNSVSSILLYNISSDDIQFRIVSLFLLFVGQMQLFDYMFWKNPSCNIINQITTKAAISVNHLQPIVLFLLQTFYGIKQSSFSLIILCLYIGVGIFYNIKAFSTVTCTKPVEDILKWSWNELPGNYIYYLLFIAYLVVASFNFKDTVFQLFSAFVSILTFFIAHKTPVLNKSVGRIWCYYAALMPLAYIGLYGLKK
jgi:hypothetical protein